MLMNKFILAIRGPSGSGKSTLAKGIQEYFKEKVAHLRADYFYWKVCPQDKNKHLDENPIVYQNLSDLAENYLENGYSVIIDGILNRIDDYGLDKRLTEHSDKFNAKYLRICLEVDLEIAKKRTDINNFSIPIEEVEGWAKGHEMKVTDKDIVIDTSEKSQDEVLQSVLKLL
jgi:adenylate kinase family enzyme